MASEHPTEIGWTPPRPPAPPMGSGANLSSSRGKLRSEYQARLGGTIVKKRRAGALKFSATAGDSAPRRGAGQATGTGVGKAQLPAANTPPPPPPGGSVPPRKGNHQTSLLDFCTVRGTRLSAIASGSSPSPRAQGRSDRQGAGGAEAGTTDAEIIVARQREELDSMNGGVRAVVSPSPISSAATRVVEDADMDVDLESGEEQEAGAAAPSPPPAAGISGTQTPVGSSGRGSSAGLITPTTLGRSSPSPDSFGLLGGGVTVAIGGGSGGGSSAGGGSRMIDSRAVYSDRFIPSRFGSVLESGSPFLAGSPPHSSPTTNGAGNRSMIVESRRGSIGGAGIADDEAAAVAAWREAVDPGGIRGTEGVAAAPGRARPGGTAGTWGAGGAGGDAAAAVAGQYWPYGSSATDAQREGQTMLNMLLKSELLGADGAVPGRSESAAAAATAVMTDGGGSGSGRRRDAAGGAAGAATAVGEVAGNGGSTGSSPNVFRFKVPRQAYEEDVTMSYSISPVSLSTKLLSKPGKAKRKIPKIPFKVLDAPQLQDDFYLNLVDWSSQNVLAVGLGACVYLWSACTSKVTKLCDLGRDTVASVAWTQRGTHLGVGTNTGLVQIWDTAKCNKIRTMTGHANRVGTMSWNAHSLASGSRDRLILMRDVRAPEPFTDKLVGHKQEVCGLRWSFDDKQLASGGNDNKLFIWNAHSTSPVLRFSEHTAAVKAIAWSPHQHGILASGGGTADRCIRFWNSQTSARLSHVDTGSQVCNLMWSKNINEIVSTHGYSLNQIIVWRYPSMTKVTTLTGHTMRVLYLAMSPDGQTIVTGAGDETLRFWNAFPGPKSKDGSGSTGLLFPAGVDIR